MEPWSANGSNYRNYVARLLWWSRLLNAWSNIKVCVNSELRPPAVNSVKWGKVFVIQTLDKEDSAVRVTLLPGTTFLLINGLWFTYKCFTIFYVFFKKLAGQHARTQRLAVILSSVTRCGRNKKQCVLLEIEYVK